MLYVDKIWCMASSFNLQHRGSTIAHLTWLVFLHYHVRWTDASAQLFNNVLISLWPNCITSICCTTNPQQIELVTFDVCWVNQYCYSVLLSLINGFSAYYCVTLPLSHSWCKYIIQELKMTILAPTNVTQIVNANKCCGCSTMAMACKNWLLGSSTPQSNLACFHYRPLVDIVFWACNILESSGRKKWGGPSPLQKVGVRTPRPSLKLCLWVWGGAVPLPRKFEFFISKWCDIVHSGCVVFNIHVSHGLYFIEVPVCA